MESLHRTKQLIKVTTGPFLGLCWLVRLTNGYQAQSPLQSPANDFANSKDARGQHDRDSKMQSAISMDTHGPLIFFVQRKKFQFHNSAVPSLIAAKKHEQQFQWIRMGLSFFLFNGKFSISQLGRPQLDRGKKIRTAISMDTLRALIFLSNGKSC